LKISIPHHHFDALRHEIGLGVYETFDRRTVKAVQNQAFSSAGRHKM
jgi:hypothetical protein